MQIKLLLFWTTQKELLQVLWTESSYVRFGQIVAAVSFFVVMCLGFMKHEEFSVWPKNFHFKHKTSVDHKTNYKAQMILFTGYKKKT